MTIKHTPGRLGRNIPPVSKYPVLYAGRNTHVAQVITRDLPPEEAEANADYLCLAWNEFPAMLEALRDVLPLLDMAFGHEGDVFGIQHNNAVDVDAAIRAILSRIDKGAA